jgi:hypothetical protein
VESLNRSEEVRMKKICLVLLTLAIIGCGAPQKQVWEDHYDFSSNDTRESYTVSAEPRFSDDPLLDSIYRYRYLKCLERCSKCDK